MNRKFVDKYKIKLIVVVISILLLIFYSFRFSTIFDEDYTLELVHNTFSNIIKLDSLDVHPPLYYFLLKIFLGISTFWTKSLLIKIIFARIFSVVVSIITFVFLVKICRKLSIKNDMFIQWLLFLSLPGVISFTYEFIKIRMYSLGALFVVIEFYELIKYDQDFYTKNLIIVTVMAIFTFYTNYYAALISGLLLLFYFIKYIVKRNENWLKFFISGIIVIISFLPWIPVLLKQLSLQNSHPQGGFIKQWLATIILISLFVYPLCYSYKYVYNKKLCYYFSLSFIILITLFICMSVLSVIDQSVFQFRYFYPIFIIYGFLGFNVLIINKKKDISIILLILIFISFIGAYSDQCVYYGCSSVKIVIQFNRWKASNKNFVYLYPINNVDQNFDVEKMMYLSDIDKSFNMPKYVTYIKDNVAYHLLFKRINSRTVNFK